MALQADFAIFLKTQEEYADVFRVLFKFMTNMDSMCSNSYLPPSKATIPRADLVDEDITLFIHCIQLVLYNDLIELLDEMPDCWLMEFEQNTQTSFSRTKTQLRTEPENTFEILFNYLTLVLGVRFLSLLRADVQKKTSLDHEPFATIIKEKAKWTFDQSMKVWLGGLADDVVVTTVSKKVERFVEMLPTTEWRDRIHNSNILRNHRIHFLQESLIQSEDMVSKLFARTRKLENKCSEQEMELTDLQSDFDYQLNLTNEIVGQLEVEMQLLQEKESKLQTLKIPTQCMVYRGYIEKVTKHSRIRVENDSETNSVGLIWKTIWESQVNNAISTESGPVWDILSTLKDNTNPVVIGNLKSTGSSLYSRLSKPIHNFFATDEMPPDPTYFNKMERQILPIIKSLASKTTKSKVRWESLGRV